MVFVSHEIYPKICPKICLDENIVEKSRFSRNFRQTHLLEVGVTKIPEDHET